MKQRSLYKFRDWFFDLLIDYLVNSGWVIIIRDFKKSEKRSERNLLGQTNYQEEIIYLDKDCGVHEPVEPQESLSTKYAILGLGLSKRKCLKNYHGKS